jgi:diguanylate cyclase (GGDEF)-like protein
VARRYRLNLTLRTLVVFAGVAALSTALALLVQDRALSADLERAAARRLERAVESTRLLVDGHVQALADRYRSISGTPQFRATLEVGDGATLRYFAGALAEREGAALVAFVDEAGHVTAAAGETGLVGAALATGEDGLVAWQGRPWVTVSVPLETAGRIVGRLLAVEPVAPHVVERWSDLCGAEVSFAAPGHVTDAVLERVVASLGGLELHAAISLQAERGALRNSRMNLLFAGAVALGIAFAVSVWVARSLVRPILDIQDATVRIGAGDLDGRLASRRSDELGDVARAFDGMLDRLRDSRRQVERKNAELEDNLATLRRSQADLAAAQRMARIGSWHVSFPTGELHGSDEFHLLLGLEPSDKPLAPQLALSRVHARDRRALEEAVRAALEEGAILRLDCRVGLADAPERILRVQAQLVRTAEGSPARLEGTIQDITERKRSEEQIRYLAQHDALTGLGNRRMCIDHLEIQIARARRQGEVVGVLFLDLDRFKRINDTLGHSLGDELLKGVADRLVGCLRAGDYVGRSEGDSAVSRLGGDEFTIAVTTSGDVQDLALVARRILQTLARPFVIGGQEIVVAGSIGISAFPAEGDDPEALLHNAEAAMYHVKEQRRGDYQFFDESMNEAASERLRIESRLRRGIDDGEFELHYQPKVSLSGPPRITGVEALLRWRDPEVGLVSPAVFIPVAEESGLILPLGDWVMRRACEQIAAWSAAGHRVPVSVNLSVHQLRTGDFSDRVLAILEATGADPTLLEIEITESTLMADERAFVAELERLRARGIEVSVDDFGTGYSSFAYLRQLPVDALKVDRSFVDGIERDAEGAALTASIVSMGRALGLRVIAEGVETEGQRVLLAGFGCDEMQGFLFSAAVPADQLERRFGELAPA